MSVWDAFKADEKEDGYIEQVDGALLTHRISLCLKEVTSCREIITRREKRR